MNNCRFCPKTATRMQVERGASEQPLLHYLCTEHAKMYGRTTADTFQKITPSAEDIRTAAEMHELLQWFGHSMETDERKLWIIRLENALLMEPLSKALHAAIRRAKAQFNQIHQEQSHE